jgi:hypothetical protein
MSKKLAIPHSHDVHAFDKLYLPLPLHIIFPELGSTLGYCIEALSIPVKTAEDPYATKTPLQRAGQYLKCNALDIECANQKDERDAHGKDGV